VAYALADHDPGQHRHHGRCLVAREGRILILP
jgi:hypothetical protein